MHALRAFWALVLASAATSFAQVNPAPAPISPARSSAVISPTGAQDVVRLQFPNSDVQDVLRLYETLTGKRVITDNTVQGKVNIFLSRDVPKDEAVRIIETNLLMNGFAMVAAEPDIVKVIGTAKNARG